MIKVSIKLDKRRRLNSGRFPLKFKVARKDSAIYIPTGYELKEDEWDAKNEKVKGLPEQRVINMKLMKRLSLLNDKIVQLQEEGKLRYFSNKKLSLYLSNDEDEQEYKNHLFKTQMDAFLATKDNEGTKLVYTTTASKISNYCDYESLRLEDIDIEWLDGFVESLKKDKNTKNTIAVRLRGIRAVLNFARKKGLLKEYVFNMYSIKMEETKKRSLTVEELRKLHDAKSGRKPIPVWHKSRGKEYFVEMCKNYPYVAIGGIVTKEIPINKYEKLFPWFVKTAHKYGCKIHALGYTNIRGLHTYHFDSVDSTAWLYGNMSGSIYKFNAKNGTMDKTKAPEGKKLRSKLVAAHNFGEWVRFMKYARARL